MQVDSIGLETWPLPDWPVATPQSMSMSPDSLQAFDDDIVSGKYGYIDKVIITRNGKLLYQKTYSHDYDKIYGDSARTKGALNPYDPSGQYNYYNPWWHPYYRRGGLHSLQSVTKTITSVIIGVATTRKEFPQLSTPVLSFFDTSNVKNIDDRKRKLTIRHLLTMTAGFDWDEDFIIVIREMIACAWKPASIGYNMLLTNKWHLSLVGLSDTTVVLRNYCPIYSGRQRDRTSRSMQ